MKKKEKTIAYTVICGGYDTKKLCNIDYQKIIKAHRNAYIYTKSNQYFIMCASMIEKEDAGKILSEIKKLGIKSADLKEE